MTSNTQTQWSGEKGREFTTTHWSVVLKAGRGDNSEASAALEQLCRTYWYPLYVWIRRQGHDRTQAEDLIQEFFARFISKNSFREANPAKGKFRSYLLGSLKHFLANEWDRAHARKRGGGRIMVSLDETDPEERYRFEPVDNLTAEKLYERRWALTLLQQALERLKHEFATAGKAVLFEGLKDCLLSREPPSRYASLAPTLQLSEGALKVTVHRLRRRYRALLREEVAKTVSSANCQGRVGFPAKRAV